MNTSNIFTCFTFNQHFNYFQLWYRTSAFNASTHFCALTDTSKCCRCLHTNWSFTIYSAHACLNFSGNFKLFSLFPVELTFQLFLFFLSTVQCASADPSADFSVLFNASFKYSKYNCLRGFNRNYNSNDIFRSQTPTQTASVLQLFVTTLHFYGVKFYSSVRLAQEYVIWSETLLGMEPSCRSSQGFPVRYVSVFKLDLKVEFLWLRDSASPSSPTMHSRQQLGSGAFKRLTRH